MNEIYPLQILSQNDTKLACLIKSIGNYNINLCSDPFESLLRSIIYQQLSGRSANAIYTRFIKYYGGKIPSPQQVLATPHSNLRNSVGLSFRKIDYIKDLSGKIHYKQLNLKLLSNFSDDLVIEELMKVKGIGRWTAEMFLIFCLGREDVLPLGDLGLKKAIQRLYDLPYLPDKTSIIEISSCWKPFRSMATWYLWKSLNFESIG